jgi:hypothetical protein
LSRSGRLIPPEGKVDHLPADRRTSGSAGGREPAQEPVTAAALTDLETVTLIHWPAITDTTGRFRGCAKPVLELLTLPANESRLKGAVRPAWL